jgi:hypothetical protein
MALIKSLWMVSDLLLEKLQLFLGIQERITIFSVVAKLYILASIKRHIRFIMTSQSSSWFASKHVTLISYSNISQFLWSVLLYSELLNWSRLSRASSVLWWPQCRSGMQWKYVAEDMCFFVKYVSYWGQIPLSLSTVTFWKQQAWPK